MNTPHTMEKFTTNINMHKITGHHNTRETDFYIESRNQLIDNILIALFCQVYERKWTTTVNSLITTLTGHILQQVHVHTLSTKKLVRKTILVIVCSCSLRLFVHVAM